MPVALHEEGSQTAVIGTEHTLNTTSPELTDGVFQLLVDVNAMVLGDTLELRIKEKARAADTQRQGWLFTLVGPQLDTLFIAPTVILLQGWAMTLKQTTGTGRAFPWSIRKIT